MNYCEGLSFRTSINVLHWLWGENTPDEPYESVPLKEIAQHLQLYTSCLDDTYMYSLTVSRIHAKSQGPYESRNMFSWMLGEVIWSEEQNLRRFDLVHLPVPSRKGAVDKVE